MWKYTKHLYPCLIIVTIWLQFAFNKTIESRDLKTYTINLKTGDDSTYQKLNLNSLGLSKAAFDNAVKGYNVLKQQGKLVNDNMLSIIDFSLPSSSRRLFVIDMKNNILLFNSLVSHGRNSGLKTAEHFSNAPESMESSLGFYLTADTYKGKHGYSLRLQGQESGINDNAFERGIVMHSASYVNDEMAKQQGYIGRSEGCPAVPENLYKSIIEKIKGGSCLYIYAADKFYASHSKIINRNIFS